MLCHKSRAKCHTDPINFSLSYGFFSMRKTLDSNAKIFQTKSLVVNIWNQCNTLLYISWRPLINCNWSKVMDTAVFKWLRQAPWFACKCMLCVFTNCEKLLSLKANLHFGNWNTEFETSVHIWNEDTRFEIPWREKVPHIIYIQKPNLVYQIPKCRLAFI